MDMLEEIFISLLIPSKIKYLSSFVLSHINSLLYNGEFTKTCMYTDI